MWKILTILITICFVIIGCATISTVNNFQFQQYTYTHKPQFDDAPIRIVNIYIDKNFSVEDKLAMRQAVKEWNYVLNDQILLIVIDDNFDMEPALLKEIIRSHDFMFLKVNSQDTASSDDCKKIKNYCKYTLAWCDSVGGTTVKVVRDKMKTEDVKYVMMHEIGHLLFLEHNVNDINSLMYPIYTKTSYSCIDMDSALKVARILKLNFNYVNYCLKY